jgi:PAS domain S-box-containing protein
MSEAAHRILVVEDQRLIAADLENTLKKLGYIVVGNVPSGEEAVSASDRLGPELVLMDVRLGGEMDGIQTAEIIRDRFNVPVVYLTAYADEETILRAKKTTPFGYLVKPFNERELRATIEIAFYTHQMERTLADERARRHAAEEFKILVEGVTDYAIFMLDGAGRIATWNSGAERLKGYKEDEIIGKDFSIFYSEEARQAGLPKRMLETAQREGRCEDENWRIRKDGTRFWASVTITPIRDESENLIGFAKVTRDLTERHLADERLEAERKEAARVLSESEEKFRLLVDKVRDYAIFFVDPELRIMTWNVGAERLYGYSADEIVGQSVSRFYLPKDVIAGELSLKKRQTTEQGVATAEGVRLRKDGSRFWVSAVYTALRDNAGQLRGFATVARDISEQKHAQQSMAILADASRLLSESLESEQILFTIAHMVVPAFADVVLIHVRDPQGQPRLELFHASNAELVDAIQKLQRRGAFRVAAPSRRVMQTGSSELHPTLTPEWLRRQEVAEEVAALIQRFGISSTIHVPISWTGRPFAVIVFASSGTRVYNDRDLIFAEELARRASTAMHNAELFHNAKAERERVEEEVLLRERLVAIVGHDLRNPLYAISMAAEMLSSQMTPASEHLVNRIQRSASRMTRMIGQILDFARIRSGQSFDLRIESADLRHVCQAVIDEFRFSKPDQEITLTIEGETYALIDADRVTQMLSNLIGNAIQHGTREPVDVIVRQTESNAVTIEVHNIGPAIPRAMQPHLFEPFHRETAAGNHRSSIGLGLFIANEIVLAHGGSITVRSPDRNGTTFSVVLPRTYEAAA